MDDLILEFIAETNESIGELDSEIVRLEQNPDDIDLLNGIFRLMHTIKGTCGFLGLERLQKLAHAGENILDKMRNKELAVTSEGVTLILECIDSIKFLVQALEQTGEEPEGEDSAVIMRLNAYEGSSAQVIIMPASEEEASISSGEAFHEDDFVPVPATMTGLNIGIEAGIEITQKAQKNSLDESASKSSAQAAIRVNVDTLENLMQLVSELVLTRNQMMQLLRTNPNLSADFTAPFHRLGLITTDLQEGVMKTRMQPIGSAWSKLPRIIRDLSVELGKKIDLKMVGEETELDRQMLELVKDPLTHMVRNSVDHGIERPSERIAAGKPETGIIHLSAFHEGGHIIMQIKDDGKGIDAEVIARKAVEKGLATQAEIDQMDEREIFQFIFAAGFSTAAEVTSVSGRGVGMDVVRTNVEKMGGSIDLTSEKGRGSTFQMKIPLTLAIMPVLLMEASGQRFAMPQINVVELVRTDSRRETGYKIERVNNSEVLRLRGRLLPLINLSDALGLEKNESQAKYVAVCEQGTMKYGLIVDRIFDTEEIVVKPVSSALRSIALYSGSTILGDGSVVMILDPNGLAKSINIRASQQESELEKKIADNDKSVSFLLFKAGEGAPKAVPLELVSRLEEVRYKDIEKAGEFDVVQYRGELMRLTKLGNDYDYKRSDIHKNSIIVFNEGEKVLGLVVEKIIDIVNEEVDIALASDGSANLGSMVIAGKTTDIVDVAYLFKSMFNDWGKYIPSETQMQTKGRILVVEDSLFFRKMIVPAIASQGYEVKAVGNGLEAVNLLQKDCDFQLIISDIDMPEMNGLEFAEACKGDARLKNIPMVALTATTKEGARKKTIELGFADYISKSDRERLFMVISKIFSNESEGVAYE